MELLRLMVLIRADGYTLDVLDLDKVNIENEVNMEKMI